jgi:hydrogenase expression/formation protein HypC
MCLAVPGQIVDVREGSALERSGHVRFGGIVKEVNLAFVPEAVTGSWVIVHVGFAISVLDEAEARQTLRDLETIGEL